MKVLDTDVIVELLRGNRDVIERRRQTTDRVVTTWMVASELYYGAAKSSHPQGNEEAVADFLDTLDVLSLDDAAVRQFGRIKAEFE